EKVKQDLANEGLVPDDWGGDTICVPISALNNIGIDDLLENILLATEVAELKANPNRPAQGTVIEGKLDEKRGVVANLLVQNGTLKQGDVIVIGAQYGRVRAMFNDRGQKIKAAGPSMPVSILGMPEVPEAGEIFEVVKNKKAAEAMVAERLEELSAVKNQARAPMSLEDFLTRLEGEEVKELNLIVKADVNGSLEPIINSLKTLGDEQHKVHIVLKGTGNISESDVTLAVASNAIVVGFNVSVDEAARRTAEVEKVEIRLYRVIYKLIEDIDLALKGLYEPVYEDRVIGHAEVRATFRVGKRIVAGSYVTAGKFTRHAKVRVVRDRELIYTGEIASLKRFTEDVEEVATGYECGISVDGFNDFKVGDILEAFVREQVN
ncbi:MAG TPA: translation initiation factor IF-2, partial [Anaerolineae bacterium]|nr:translation initiation factor IF-2 [Anaerolineae bacterium]